MKFPLFTTLILSLPTASFAAIIMEEDFEDNTVKYTLGGGGEFYDTADDHFTITPLNGANNPDDGPYSGFSGNYFSADDINDSAGPGLSTQTLTFTINISGFENLSFSGLFAAGNSTSAGIFGPNYDDEDGIRVRAFIDGGIGQNLFALEAAEPGGDISNNELRQDTDFDGIGDGAIITNIATSTGQLAIAGTGNQLILEIEVTATAGGEELAFDTFLVEGERIPEPSSVLMLALGSSALILRRKRKA